MWDWIKLETLGWINRIRIANGRPTLAALQSGKPRQANNCPVANSFGQCSAAFYNEAIVYGDRYEVPWYVRMFMKHFDRKKYPELIELRMDRHDDSIDHLDFPADIENLTKPKA